MLLYWANASRFNTHNHAYHGPVPTLSCQFWHWHAPGQFRTSVDERSRWLYLAESCTSCQHVLLTGCSMISSIFIVGFNKDAFRYILLSSRLIRFGGRTPQLILFYFLESWHQSAGLGSYLEIQTTPCSSSMALSWSGFQTPGVRKDCTKSEPQSSIVWTKACKGGAWYLHLQFLRRSSQRQSLSMRCHLAFCTG